MKYLTYAFLLFFSQNIYSMECTNTINFGPKVFGEIRIGDDESSFFCALKKIELPENSTLTIETNLPAISTRFDSSFYRPTFTKSEFSSLKHWDDILAYVMVSPNSKDPMSKSFSYMKAVEASILSDMNKPLMDKRIIALNEINPSYPDVLWLTGVCSDIEISEVLIGSASFKMTASFDGYDQYSYLTLVQRLNQKDSVGFYDSYQNKNIYTSCRLSQLKFELNPEFSNATSSIAITPKLVKEILSKTNQKNTDISKLKYNHLKAEIQDSLGMVRVTFLFNTRNEDHQNYLISFSFYDISSKAKLLTNNARKELDALQNESITNLNKF